MKLRPISLATRVHLSAGSLVRINQVSQGRAPDFAGCYSTVRPRATDRPLFRQVSTFHQENCHVATHHVSVTTSSVYQPIPAWRPRRASRRRLLTLTSDNLFLTEAESPDVSDQCCSSSPADISQSVRSRTASRYSWCSRTTACARRTLPYTMGQEGAR